MKATVASIFAAAILIGGAIAFTSGRGDSNNGDSRVEDNVSVVDGKQIVEIDAKGGYFPGITAAKAGIPTVIKINTRGTFDCSSVLAIPSLNYRANLPPSGVTDIDVPAQKSGTKLRGLCAMGMYNFLINFD